MHLFFYEERRSCGTWGKAILQFIIAADKLWIDLYIRKHITITLVINWCWSRHRDRAAKCQKSLFIYFLIGLSWASQSISLLSLLLREVIKGVLIYWQPTVTFSLLLLFSISFHFQAPWEEKFRLRRSRKPHFAIRQCTIHTDKVLQDPWARRSRVHAALVFPHTRVDFLTQDPAWNPFQG